MADDLSAGPVLRPGAPPPTGPPAGLPTAAAPPDDDLTPLGADELAARLRRLSDEVGRLYHDANNPLAVISGNAQLLLEIGAAEGLSRDVMEPVADIEVAAQRLVAVLRRLARLRDDVAPFRS